MARTADLKSLHRKPYPLLSERGRQNGFAQNLQRNPQILNKPDKPPAKRTSIVWHG
jgi:hypothetical protein